jgi:hypothetical protein
MALHIGYESVEPWPIRRVDESDGPLSKAGNAPIPALRPAESAGTKRKIYTTRSVLC